MSQFVVNRVKKKIKLSFQKRYANPSQLLYIAKLAYTCICFVLNYKIYSKIQPYFY